MKRIAVMLAILAAATACKPPPTPVPPRHTLTCQFPPIFKHATMALPVVEVLIGRDGHVTWNGDPIDRKHLEDYLAYAGAVDLQPIIAVGARDADMPYASIAPVLRLIYEKKAYRLGMETSHVLTAPPELGRMSRRIAAECWIGPSQTPDPKTQDEIEITAEGDLRWNGDAVSRENFAKHLDQTGRTVPQPLVILKIAPKTQFRAVSDLMYDIELSGIERMRFETD